MNIKYSLFTIALLKTALLAQDFKVDANIRVGYQTHKIDTSTTKQDSIGGKLHIETKIIKDISASATFYTTNTISHDNDVAINFLDSKNSSYSILGEAYLEGIFRNTTIKIGR